MDFDASGSFDDYNQNGVQDGPGWVDVNVTTSPPRFTFSPAIRPYSLFPGPTPASLLMSNLQPFERTSSFAKGAIDGVAGAPGDDDGQNGSDSGDPGEIGWPDTDDPEPLNTDPDDPTFKLSTWLFDTNLVPLAQSGRRTAFVTGTSSVNFVDAFHDFYTFHTPLIVSAGQDRRLGLFEPTDVPTTANPTSVNFGFLAAPQPVARRYARSL